MDNIFQDIISILLMVVTAAFVIFLCFCLWYLTKYLKKELGKWGSE